MKEGKWGDGMKVIEEGLYCRGIGVEPRTV